MNYEEIQKLIETMGNSKLDTLSPLKTLTRGYSIIEKNGGIVKSITDLQKDDEISIRLKDGEKQAKII